MMPSREDMLVAINAASLSEAQTKELAKLPCGVAMVFQNSWTDAILCKIHYFDVSKQPPYHYHLDETPASAQALVRNAIRILMRNKYDTAKRTSLTYENMPAADYWINCGYVLGKKRKYVKETLEEFREKGKDYTVPLVYRGQLLEEILEIKQLMRQNLRADSIRDWAEAVNREVYNKSGLESEEVHLVISTVLLARAETQPEYRKLYTDYLVYENNAMSKV